ncbi:MAG: type II toxin-antitoxin system VapC family toxin [Planctomycetota bacterium]|nr:type II toxin-antitoxin system VapC family toxin [Planctomycetota bacterium]
MREQGTGNRERPKGGIRESGFGVWKSRFVWPSDKAGFAATQRRRRHFEVYVSQLVVDEAGRGDQDAVNRRVAILHGVARLQVTAQAVALARELVEAHALPRESLEDALHIALAATNGMDLLMTWNCKHIANAEMAPAIRATIERCRYDPPIICTPDELMGESL